MKKYVAVLLCLVTLALTGTAGAVANGYWHHHTALYDCEGLNTTTLCKTGGYLLLISPKIVGIYQDNNRPVFTCKLNRSLSGCFDLRGLSG